MNTCYCAKHCSKVHGRQGDQKVQEESRKGPERVKKTDVQESNNSTDILHILRYPLSHLTGGDKRAVEAKVGQLRTSVGRAHT